MVGVSRQTRLGQQAAEKYGTASAGLVRQYGTHLEKTRKSLPAVAHPQASCGSKAGLQANPQTPGSPLRQWRCGVTPTASLDAGTCRQSASDSIGSPCQDDASEQSGQDEYDHARTGAHAKRRGIRVQFKSDPACLR